MISLHRHQESAIAKLTTGSILWGGVGSGKSLTALVYYYRKQGGVLNSGNSLVNPPPLYIITTARKRDSQDWEAEAEKLGLSITVDSWNNCHKYIDTENAFFIFDEQRVIGSGSWVKSFLKITKSNDWILLTATPGDTWMDYIPVFVAHGFYKNRTEFLRRHVVYNNFSKFPKVDHYVEVGILEKLKSKLLVEMVYQTKATIHNIDIDVEHNKEALDIVLKRRWNPFKNVPIKHISELGYLMRRVVNSDQTRIDAVRRLLIKHKKLIVFYNFDYELEALRKLKEDIEIPISEYNGHYHEDIPIGDSWIYLVQYTSASEAWNCIETNAIISFSLNYSYRMMVQAAGRINRMNTPFGNLYYYRLSQIRLLILG